MLSRDQAGWTSWPGIVKTRTLPLPSTCLRVSLVQVAVLRRREVPATLRLGVRREDGVLDFHAWVDCDGPLDDPGALQRALELARERGYGGA